MVQLTRVGSLDFDDIKLSIKNYLSQQAEFTDYDFEASGLSQIINILAYNAHYDALAANFLANESFLDTAVNRGSVVSIAKEYGYTPRSRTSSRASVTLTVSNVTNDNLIESLVLPRGSRFTSQIGDGVYTYTTIAAISIPRLVEDALYIYRNTVNVYEGMLAQHTVTYSSVDKTVSIPNVDVDVSTLKVEVYENNSWQEYTKPSTLLSVTDTSKVYMIQEGFNGFEIYFGDGVIGYNPADGSLVRMTYVVTSGAEGNGAVNFTLASTIANTVGANFVVTSSASSSGGAEKESIDSIKFNTVNQYGTQNRAVVASDYASLTLQNYADVKDCLAWDGSDNVPPKFGKVILCAQPTIGDVLTTTQKTTIATFLETKGVANTKVEFVNPEYIDLIVDSTVRYNVNDLNIGTYELEYLVKTAINDYAKTTINKFGSKLRYSALIRSIDDSNYAIMSNLTSIRLLKTVIPNLFAKNNIRFSYVNELTPNTFTSTIFFIGTSPDRMYLKDNGSGRINMVYDVNGLPVVYQSGIGSIDYSNGTVQIDNLEPSQLEGLNIQFTVTPLNQDLMSSQNVILNLSTENIEVSVLPDYS